MTAVPRPENVGDIYKVHDYPFPGAVSYGAAYKSENKLKPNHWMWWIEMDNGDLFPWLDDGLGPDIDGSGAVELMRRNPLPEKETP